MISDPNIRYSVAASLSGYIAGPNGEYDWIPVYTRVDTRTGTANVNAGIYMPEQHADYGIQLYYDNIDGFHIDG